MYRKKHSTYRGRYYLQFQASTEDLGMYLSQVSGGYVYEVPRIVKCIEMKSRMALARVWGKGRNGSCFMGIFVKFPKAETEERGWQLLYHYIKNSLDELTYEVHLEPQDNMVVLRTTWQALKNYTEQGGMDRGPGAWPTLDKGKMPYMLALRRAKVCSRNQHAWGTGEGSLRHFLRGFEGSHLCPGPDLASGSGKGHVMEQSLLHRCRLFYKKKKFWRSIAQHEYT